MGWNEFYERKHSTYVGRNDSDDEDLLLDDILSHICKVICKKREGGV